MRSAVMCMVALLSMSGSSWAVQPDSSLRQPTNIPEQSLDSALQLLAKDRGLQMVYSYAVVGDLRTRGVSGELTFEEALVQMLEGTELTYRYIDAKTVTIVRQSKADRRDGMPVDQMRLADSGAVANVSSAGAPAASSEDDASASAQEVVVTGSRVATNPSQMAANVIVLDAQALQATGESKLEDALRQLPQNIFGASAVGAAAVGNVNGAINITGATTINLRGLGSESTLILIDGRRIGKSGVYGGISDISGIPLRSVERVEIMLDGASSVYGSDAVGGVVNIITKKDYSGAEAGYQYGIPEKGGFDEHVVTLSGGMSWRNGRTWMMFEGYRHSDLDGADRPEIIKSTFATNPGGLDLMFARYQGQIYRASEVVSMLGVDTYYQYLADGSIELLNGRLPADHEGLSLSISDLVFTPLYLSSSGGVATNLVAERGVGISILPAQERLTFQAGFEQALPLPGSTQLTGNIYYSRRDTYAATGSFEFVGQLPASDPRNLLGETTYLRWSIPDWADKHYATDQDVLRGSLALDGTLAGRFRWQLSAGQSRDNMNSYYYNAAVGSSYFTPELIALYEQYGIPVDLRYTQAYDAGLNILAGDILAANSPDLLARLVVPRSSTLALNRENNAEFRIDGPLFSMPGGKAHMAVGMDWRQEMLRTASESQISQYAPLRGGVGSISTAALPSGAFDEVSIGRTQHAMFAEILLPLVGQDNEMSLIRRLNLTGAARRDDYHGFDAASTWSAGLIWSPVNALNLRVNRSTSYVVPTFRDQLTPTTRLDNVVYYPGQPGRPLLVVDANGVPTGEVEYIGFTISGGNPDLAPENADITSAGVEFVPLSLPGLTLRATWHHTAYRDRIGSPPTIEGLGWSSDLFAEVISAGDYETRYGSTFYREADGRFTLDARSTNISRVELAGIDYQARYDFATSIGRFILNANVGYTSQYDMVQQAGDPRVNQVGSVGFESQAVIPEYRYSADAQWYHHGFSVSLGASTASTTVSTGDDGYGEIIQRTARYPLKLDLVLGFDADQSDFSSLPAWTRGMSASLRIPRLLDDTTRYSVMNLTRNERYAYAELNANVADPIGRVFYLGLSKRF